MRLHSLKCWREPFEAMRLGTKTFEYRRDDRGFTVGDVLHLKEWDENLELFTGRDLLFQVIYVLAFPHFGVPDGFVVMGVRPCDPPASGEG